ncbi:urea ABC transporter substrate-binding protein [Conexibacter sp. JD483]|nr:MULTISPECIES: urea ABC transporter substrate-binding protein [unclassified Conexibacter]MDO8188835.1 urea ABC transporter substrate-binding protein [Conexibacter sp. CPCC 205706]MDO8201177.1 urea ABC transporter substrate-binding protein [Conexibacter sp. CPCC 205762]MDR9371904.1 urea ABC transporter substrate-binding protein [Conexibacter sp. JD483]
MTRLLAILAAAILAAAAIAGCGSSSSESDAADTGASTSASADSGGDAIKVGILHSLSGTMAISEVTVRDSELLAIDEINRSGGVLGKQIEPVIEDGASDWPTFAEKAQKLISEDRVAATFGGWTSASRKAMLPVFESNRALLFYPVQYEGLEQSPYIFYSGATTNQQIIPGLEYLKEQGARSLFLVGSDYVFPRTANKEIKAWARANDVEILGEEYTPLGHTEYGTLISKLQEARPDAVFNTLNGDSNVAFFKQLKGAGVSARDMPVMSVSVAEEEVAGIGPENIAGHPVAWNYYQTTDTPENRRFVRAFKDRYGADRVTSDPMEAGYVQVHIWAKAVEKAGSTDPEKVKEAARGLTFDAPEGRVRVDDVNQHLYKTARIGVIEPDGQIREVWSSGRPIAPDPYLRTYDWASGL